MTKEEAYELATMQELGGNPNGTRQDVVWRAMELYAKQEAIEFLQDFFNHIEVNGTLLKDWKEINPEQLYNIFHSHKSKNIQP